LPLPGPAKMSIGPSGVSTASLWAGLSVARMSMWVDKHYTSTGRDFPRKWN